MERKQGKRETNNDKQEGRKEWIIKRVDKNKTQHMYYENNSE